MTLDTIKATLTGAGVATYEVAQKVGQVNAAYCVVRELGTREQPGTRGMLGWRTYEVICLVPAKAPEEMPALIGRVKQALAALPLRYAGEGETGVEETFLGIGKSMMYTHACRLA